MSRRILWIIGIAALAVGIIVWSSLFTVHQTQQALVLQFGDPKQAIKDPGLNFKLPFVQNVEYFDKRILSYDGAAEEIIAADQKRLVVDSFVRFRIDDPLKFFQSVGNENIARSRIGSMLNSSLRAVLGEVPLSSVLTGERAALMKDITQRVNLEAANLGVVITDVRIKRADLPEANSQAIYARMKTEREREAREFRAQGAEEAQRVRSRADREKRVLLAEAQKQAQILRGHGDGERNRIFAGAYGQDPEFFAFYRSMQAYSEALTREDTTMVLTPDSDFFRFFNSIEGRGNESSK
jgi:membrane protease subunit HflC